jgi:hypothetical protein
VAFPYSKFIFFLGGGGLANGSLFLILAVMPYKTNFLLKDELEYELHIRGITCFLVI